MERQILYLECESGISGDMTVAALLDLGADQNVLKQALRSLPINGFEIAISRVKKSGLDLCDFHVVLDQVHENHDHDMEYLHGHAPENESHHEHHSHEHRGLTEILQIINQADLTAQAKETAGRIFRILAEAEAKAHGVPLKEVHFHEVGAVDSIVDIIATAVCLDDLGITDVIVAKLNEGQGMIRCQHGILPVPVPAVMNIAEAHKLPLHITETKGELVTPTGAAIVAAVRTFDRLPEVFTIEKVGMGAGKRTYDRPSMLRAMLICEGSKEKDTIVKLETNVDDCTGECLGYTMERLMEAGAKDVHYMPVYMKKNRPAYQLNVICREEDAERMEQIIFAETTTIGIRRMSMERTVQQREICVVETPLGKAKVKMCRYGDTRRFYPEYESVAALCRIHGKHYLEVFRLVQYYCGLLN
ncbi:MAG TPA: nickel pincer cofactor biosynthesis protein LarC [Lachnospiraceae bacterium]|nr:nickel pincer cofactor biosynthesis protein LarC [Lachnospiraceae bacterium]